MKNDRLFPLLVFWMSVHMQGEFSHAYTAIRHHNRRANFVNCCFKKCLHSAHFCVTESVAERGQTVNSIMLEGAENRDKVDNGGSKMKTRAFDKESCQSEPQRSC